jgi:NDP-sugar pyrophosphorylase family protein
VDALILAAGLGTRLGDIGRETPKALLEVGGITMLERIAQRLVDAGADRIIVNVHHHADRIERFVAHRDLGAEILVSHERERPLETGGALVHARHLFRRDAPIFLHNVDILTDADLRALLAAHQRSGGLATLAVNQRTTERHLLFDEQGLCGRTDTRTDLRIEVRPPLGRVRAWAFGGIHVVSPAFLDAVTETGTFAILEPYLRLAAAGHRIAAHVIDPARWLEIGTPERLEAARRVLA